MIAESALNDKISLQKWAFFIDKCPDSAIIIVVISTRVKRVLKLKTGGMSHVEAIG